MTISFSVSVSGVGGFVGLRSGRLHGPEQSHVLDRDQAAAEEEEEGER